MDILDQTSPLTERHMVANDGNRIVAYLIDVVLVSVVSIVPIVGFIQKLRLGDQWAKTRVVQ